MGVREKLFWFKDWLEGDKLNDELSKVEETMGLKLPQLKASQGASLDKLLKHAASFTPFYSAYVDLPLDQWPVIDKNIIRSQQSDFESRDIRNRNIHLVSTSGSTGTPFTVKQGPIKRLRHAADMLYFNKVVGQKVGDPVAYIRIWNAINSISPIKRLITNVMQIDGSDLSELATKKFISKMKRNLTPVVVLGYGSTLESYAFNIRNLMKAGSEEPLSEKVKVIITMAEPVSMEARSILSKFFNCKVLSRYSNSENGFLAHQIDSSLDYVINQASYKVELLALDKDVEVAPGQQGRIVVTDLFNFTTPLIRYDTGDVGVLAIREIEGKQVEVLEKILGRRMDFIKSINGELISPHVVDYAVRAIHGIQQFQLIQKSNTQYLLRINIQSKVDESVVISHLTHYLGKGAQIKLEYIDEIPVLESGKRKLVINEID